MSHEFSFPGRQHDEHVVIVLHRHWFIFVKNVLMLLLLAVIPVAAGYLWIQATNVQLLAGSFGHTAVVMSLTLYYLFLWILIYGFWLDFYLDVFVITNKRIVDIEQAGLFGRTVAEERLYRIQDVTSDTQGILATTLQYGNVYVQTAGKTERFIFEHVAHPEHVARTILELTDKIADRVEGGTDDGTAVPPKKSSV